MLQVSELVGEQEENGDEEDDYEVAGGGDVLGEEGGVEPLHPKNTRLAIPLTMTLIRRLLIRTIEPPILPRTLPLLDRCVIH